jgi:uroporphyrinogen-III decarboxylase
MAMTSKECFYTALSGEMPDRVPTLPKIWVDLGAALTQTDLRKVVEDPSTAMRVVVDGALAVKADGARIFHLPRRQTHLQDGTVIEVDDTAKRLGPVDMQGGLATRVSDPSIINLGDPYRAAFIQFWATREPLVKSTDDVKRIAVPEKSFYEQSGYGRIQKQVIDQVGDSIALLGDCGSATLAFHVLLRRMDNALLDLIEQPDLTHAIMEKGAAHAIEKGKFHIDTGLKMLRLNDSVANMSVISPQHWREFILPHMKTVCDELHGYRPGVRIYCHICGNVMPIMEDLVAAGLDCIGPLDPLGNFTCAQARETVGDRIALMGGVNTLSFLNSTPEKLIEEARVCIEGAGRNGGYILGSGCVVPRSAPRENLLALHAASERFGTRRYIERHFV